MHNIRRIAMVSCFLAANAGWGSDVAAPDPFVGRWLLDAGASTYSGHTCPRRMIIEMARETRGIHYHSETVPATGEIFHVDYVADYDGKPAVVVGDKGILLPVTLHRESARRVKATYTNGFQVMATSIRTISEDGRVMTVVTSSQDSLGQTHVNTGVYRRAQKP